MFRTTRLIIIVLLMAAVILSACGGESSATEQPQDSEPQDVTIYLGFRPDVQFAPFYVGIEKGIFAENGITLTIIHEAQESTMARLVGTGEAPFAVISGEQVLLARAQEVPIVYIFEWFQQYPVGVAAKAESGISTPADLAGRSVGVPIPSGASYIGLEALLSTAGLTDTDITLETTGFTQVETLMADRVDAVVVYITNEPVQLAAQGVDANIISVSDYVDLVSNGLVTSEAVIAENPDLVSAMVRAFSEAVQYTMDNSDEAFEIATSYVEGLDDPAVEVAQKAVLERSISMWQADQLGFSDRASWDTMHTLLTDIALLETQVDIQSAFTNEFLP